MLEHSVTLAMSVVIALEVAMLLIAIPLTFAVANAVLRQKP